MKIHNIAVKHRDIDDFPNGGLFGSGSDVKPGVRIGFIKFAGAWKHRADICDKLLRDQPLEACALPPLFFRRWVKGKSTKDQDQFIKLDDLARMSRTPSKVRLPFAQHYRQAWEAHFETGRDKFESPKTAKEFGHICRTLILETLFLAAAKDCILPFTAPSSGVFSVKEATPSVSLRDGRLGVSGTHPDDSSEPDCYSPGTWKRLEDGQMHMSNSG